ncbi:MAG: RNA polymerase sigma factor [Deltaproteobacteria bacterium]|nr:MAG: RNA polymerase sigma factor [Deltaproteobacteria bacterium]
MIATLEQNMVERRTEMGANKSQVAFLAESAQAGNRSSFEKLVGMFQAKIFRMAYYRTGSHMDAEDLTQDIFVKAFKGLPKLKDVNLFRPWLFSIALNSVRDFKRKKRILLFFGTESESKNFESADLDIHENPQALSHLIREEFWQHVRHFTKNLSRWEREVFLLRFLDQLSIKEIAHVLYKSESAVKTHLYRSLRKFKDNPELALLLQGETP